MKTAYLVALVLLSIGFALLAGAGYMRYQRGRFEASAARASGRVLEIVVTESGSERCLAPRVRFDVQGTAHEFVPSVRACPNDGGPDVRWSVGDEVTVLYEPANPSRADMGGGMNSWLPTIVLGIFGVVFVACGAFSVHIGRDS
ncbi:MAG: DUF3592 domain-containing protein [Acidobacteria bacterium]|nr:DUF3592 domain-containing protein [Acidobacteriota bacterium]